MSTPVKATFKVVKPVLSISAADSRRRAISLYKAWYRQIPFMVHYYDIPKSEAECRKKLKEEFIRNANISDIRVIDFMIIKGKMELQEIVMKWKPKGSVMNYWKETYEPKPKDFMSKFLSGHD